MKCLLIVDVQNDFCEGGALAVPGANEIVPVILSLVEKFELSIASQDWHPEDHCSFKENGGTWPVHCVKDTPGAALHPDLLRWLAKIEYLVRKGRDKEHDSYSAFKDDGGKPTAIVGSLAHHEVDEIYVCGLATDYCVKATVIDALKAGHKVFVIEDACRAVNVGPDGIDEKLAYDEMVDAGAMIMNSGGV